MMFGTMMAPYLVSTTQLNQYLEDRVVRRDKTKHNWVLLFNAWNSIFPTQLVLSILIDLLFMINTVISVLVRCCFQV